MCALQNGKLAVSCVNQTLVILSIDNSTEQFIIKDDLPKKLYHPILTCGTNLVLYFQNLLYFRKHEEPYSFITKKLMNGTIRHIYSLKYRNSLCVLYEKSTEDFISNDVFLIDIINAKTYQTEITIPTRGFSVLFNINQYMKLKLEYWQ